MMRVLLLVLSIAGQDPERIDLDGHHHRQVVVDREPGVYLGHVSTVLLDDRRTILAAYPKGHGEGQIILKRSDDGGLSWSERLPVPDSWSTSRETPTLFNIGGGEILLFSGLFPIRTARSTDSGRAWSQLSSIGDFGGIVAMGGMTRRTDGTQVAYFHDDGRYIREGGKATGVFTLHQIESRDQGQSWTPPRTIWSGSEVHLCEPGVVVSPDGTTWALLLRENRRVKRSHVMFSNDEGRAWTTPRELPWFLTGDRHIAAYDATTNGRLAITFRCMADGDPWKGDWVVWIGRWDDLAAVESFVPDERPDPLLSTSRERSYFVRLKDNHTKWDCAYAGMECLPDGTFVSTTYGTWIPNEQPFILSVRFTIKELMDIAAAELSDR